MTLTDAAAICHSGFQRSQVEMRYNTLRWEAREIADHDGFMAAYEGEDWATCMRICDDAEERADDLRTKHAG